MPDKIFDQKLILIIEDDKEISNLLEMHLQDIGCDVIKSHDGAEGLKLARNHHPDLIVLDILLPGLNGFDLCKELRRLDKYIPILILTAKNEEIDIILGLELGADDYMTKPFSIREFIARIKGIFRRIEVLSQDENYNKILEFRELIIDVSNKKVLLNRERINLTQIEFRLLLLLASHPGRSFSASDLLDLVWGYKHRGYEHTVTAHINRLRNKIENNPSHPEFILTTWGIGYRFNDQLESLKD